MAPPPPEWTEDLVGGVLIRRAATIAVAPCFRIPLSQRQPCHLAPGGPRYNHFRLHASPTPRPGGPLPSPIRRGNSNSDDQAPPPQPSTALVHRQQSRARVIGDGGSTGVGALCVDIVVEILTRLPQDEPESATPAPIATGA
jgi:hypothetical protein